MSEISALREEILSDRDGILTDINLLHQRLDAFRDEALAKVENAEKNVIVEELRKVSKRLDAIEEKLKEKDEDAVTSGPTVRR